MISKQIRRIKYLLSTSALPLIFLLFNFSATAQSAENGETLFNANCASCHKPHKNATGPKLQGAKQKWVDMGKEELFYEWVNNSTKVIASGDEYAVKLFEEYNGEKMNSHNLTNEEIDDIVAYVEAYIPPQADKTPDEPGVVAEESDYTIWYIIIILLFVTIIFAVGGVKKNLEDAVEEKAGNSAPEELSYPARIKAWIARNKALVSIIVLLLVVMGAVDLYMKAMDIGVYGGYENTEENYKPEQPIWFSHKIHAGENEISCNYCHHSAEKGKHAGIPSVNVCMNCHKSIDEGKKTKGTEISKIYAAIGFDGETKKYKENYTPQPIKWVKVHNLPDHVFFPHDQHVAVAGLECQECHGPIEEMDVVEQHSPLTMGWCIDCHNETKIDLESGSGYYEEIHSRLTDEILKQYNEDGKVTVRELGGWECSKCHY